MSKPRSLAWKPLARCLALGSAGSLALTGCAPHLARLEAAHPDDRIYINHQFAGTGITSLRVGGYGADRSFRIKIERPSLETYEATLAGRVEPLMLGTSLLYGALSAYLLVSGIQSPKGSLAANLNAALGGISLTGALVFFYNRFRFDDAYRVVGKGQIVRPTLEPEPPAEVAGDKAIADTLAAARLILQESVRRTTYRQLEEAALDGLGGLAPSRSSFLTAVTPVDDQRPFVAVASAVKLLADKRTPEELNRTAIEAMLRSTDDPFAEYVVPSREASGSVASIGAFTAWREGGFNVVRVFNGSRAEKAGLKAGDRLVSINGQAVQGLSYAGLNALLEGPEGTPLVLEVQRKGPKPVRVSMIREVPDLKGGAAEDLPGNIGYLRLNYVDSKIVQEVGGVLERFGDRDGVVLDLRGATGGSPFDAGKIVNGFVEQGVVAQVAGRETFTWMAAGDAALPERVRVVVLVDGGTCDAAEAIAGSLQDAKRAMLLGTRTFGNAWLLTRRPIGTDAFLKLSHGEHLTAGGRRINGAGILPDSVVPGGVDAEGRDWQILAAYDHLVNGLSPEDVARKYKE